MSPRPQVQSVATTYNGITYRSALEADWAAMFEQLEVYAEYEPQPYKLPTGETYDPDFYLPACYTYAEAKGPHNARRWKPVDLERALLADNFPGQYHVVVLRPAGPGNAAAWEPATITDPFPVLADCEDCQRYCFGAWTDNGEIRCFGCGTESRPGRRFTSARDPLQSVASDFLDMPRVPRGVRTTGGAA